MPDPLPAVWVRRLGPPDFEGEVRSISDVQVTKDDRMGKVMRYTIAGLLFPFKPLMVVMALLFGRRPDEKETNYLIRLDTVAGSMVEARIEKELRGAGISRGDFISLWGRERSGTLFVARAYNRTVGAEILLG